MTGGDRDLHLTSVAAGENRPWCRRSRGEEPPCVEERRARTSGSLQLQEVWERHAGCSTVAVWSSWTPLAHPGKDVLISQLWALRACRPVAEVRSCRILRLRPVINAFQLWEPLACRPWAGARSNRSSWSLHLRTNLPLQQCWEHRTCRPWAGVLRKWQLDIRTDRATLLPGRRRAYRLGAGARSGQHAKPERIRIAAPLCQLRACRPGAGARSRWHLHLRRVDPTPAARKLRAWSLRVFQRGAIFRSRCLVAVARRSWSHHLRALLRETRNLLAAQSIPFTYHPQSIVPHSHVDSTSSAHPVHLLHSHHTSNSLGIPLGGLSLGLLRSTSSIASWFCRLVWWLWTALDALSGIERPAPGYSESANTSSVQPHLSLTNQPPATRVDCWTLLHHSMDSGLPRPNAQIRQRVAAEDPPSNSITHTSSRAFTPPQLNTFILPASSREEALHSSVTAIPHLQL